MIEETENIFLKPLDIMRNVLGFDVSILYGISNIIDNHAIIEVIKIDDPLGSRSDLNRGQKVMIDLKTPNKSFTNEANAIQYKNTSAENVPGNGCDLVGYIFMPETADSYLFGGDYIGDESVLDLYEVNTCTIMCNILSSILMKTRYKEWARYDGLTGLLNSRTIRAKITESVERIHRKTPGSLSVILCDIDFFKKVNDTHGHMQGDSVIKEIGKIINDSMRKHFDFAGRFGGEEFLIILEDTDKKTATVISERIRKKIESYPFTKIDTHGKKIMDQHISITLSFGVASITEQEKNPRNSESILANADRALYRAKEAGRNCVKN